MLLLTVAALCLCAADVVRGRSVEPRELPAGISVHKVMATWEEASELCATEGAVVASPITTELLNAMRSVIVNNTAYFIGTKSTHFSGSFVSQEGVPLEDMRAAVLEMIEQLDPHAGDCLTMNLYSIQVVPCCDRLPFMCYKAPSGQSVGPTVDSAPPVVPPVPMAPPAPVAPPAPKQCPKGYSSYGSTTSCYKKHLEDVKKWSDASASCESEGAHLVVIDDAAEAQIIKNLNMGKYPWTYLGLKDYTEHGDWRTVTGKKLKDIHQDWETGHTDIDEFGNEYFCAGMDSTGKMQHFYCEVERKYICEIAI